MTDFTLAMVVDAIHPIAVYNIDPDRYVSGVQIDSRRVVAGDLFVPIQGEHNDGHNYVVSCIEKGAVASLWKKGVAHKPEGVPIIEVEDPVRSMQQLAAVYRRTLSTTIIGVTGSSGKTTTKDIIAAVASVGYPTQKTQENHNNEIGVPMTILSLRHDTKVAVIEMGIDDIGQMDLLGEMVRPDIAVITSLSESHIDHFGSLETIAREKYRIAHYLTDDGMLFYNGDYPLLREAEKTNPITQRVRTYGFGTDNDLFVTEHRFATDGVYFRINLQPDFEFHLPLLGDYEIQNALAAIWCGITLSLMPTEIQAGFSQVRITGRREDIRQLGHCVVIDSTYNSNPGSLCASLKMLNDYPMNVVKIAILGDMYGLGEETDQLHRRAGEKACLDHVEQLWTIGDKAALFAQEAVSRYPDLVWRRFDETDQLQKAIIEVSQQKALVLVKASRAVALDDVLKKVEDEINE